MLKLLRQMQPSALNYAKRSFAATTLLRSASRPIAGNNVESKRNQSVECALVGWDKKLQSAGVGNIDFNLKCLVAHVLKQKFSTLPDFSNLEFTSAQCEEFERLCEARCARMPLQHIIGEWDFMNLTLKTAPTVFIPRPETEEFVNLVISNFKDVKQTVSMLEVGCGSGAMSLAILNALPHVNSVALERSKAATKLAAENAVLLGLQQRFEVHNHTVKEEQYMPRQFDDTTFDLIISNPPYVKTEEFQYLQPEVVVYENLNALDGGPDGLRIARLVLDLACNHLRVNGRLWLELGNEHPPLIKTIISTTYADRLGFVNSYKDQYDRERFVQIKKL